MYVDPAKNQHASNLRWILSYCKPDLPKVAGSLVLFVVNNTMALSIPLMAGMIVDRVLVQHHNNELLPLCALMLVCTIIRVSSRYGYVMWMERFGQNSIYRLVSDEYEKLHKLDFTYFNHTRTGDIMSRMTSDTDAIRHALSWVSYQVLDCVVMFIGAIGVMMAIDWRLALALACVAPPLFLLTRGLSSHARPLFFDVRNSLARLNSMVEESIEGNRVVKAFVRESYETQRFDEHNQDYYERNMALAYNSRRYMPWLDGLGFSLQLITLGFGGYLVMSGYMTLGNLVSFTNFLWMLDGPVRQSGWLINDWQRFNASCIKIRKLLTAQSHLVEPPVITAQTAETEHEAQSDTAQSGVAQSGVAQSGVAQSGVAQSGTAQSGTAQSHNMTRPAGAVRFEHVNFAFPDDPDTNILHDINLDIPAGSKLGILGETGSGKSTLVNLISRFYDPTQGRVLIDGIDAKQWPLVQLRSNVCIVAQDTFLFSDTIGSNISFGAAREADEVVAAAQIEGDRSMATHSAHASSSAPNEDFIRRMAQIAGADDFISSLPQGYDTVVGERGVGLSGGQKQRLSLARALADDPAILIMDDTTSAVDMETEAEIQEHLRHLDHKKTIITIAHRISSVKDADLIVVLEHGHIVERGTHEELIAQHGRYWSIYHKQLGLAAGMSQGFVSDKQGDR